MLEEGASRGLVVAVERTNDLGGSGKGRPLIDLRLVMAALGEGEELAVGLELFLDDRSDLPETLHPDYGEHTGGEEADGAADQKHQLAADAQVVEEFAHSLS